jgi:predicted transcriptional regulator of viral defense system
MSVNGMELANMMYSPSYVSFETALYYHGVIFQVNPKQIDVAYKKSDTRIIESVDLIIHLRALKQSVLMNPTGVMYIKNVSLASAERAFLDMIYLNKDYYFDNLEILDQTKIQDLLGIYGREKMMKKRLKQYFPNIKV